MRKVSFLPIVTIFVFTLTSCANLQIPSSSQQITLQTHPANAECVLKNDKGQWTLANTPGAVKVARSNSPLSVTCNKAGYQTISGVMSAQAVNKHTASYENFIDVTLLPVKNNNSK